MTELLAEYERRYRGHLQHIARGLEDLVVDHLGDEPEIDRVTARAKDPSSFHEKAHQLDDAGTPKYSEPLTQIQDLVGVRVVVLYHATVERVSSRLSRYLHPIEEKTLVPESNWEFGYIGRHVVAALPSDVIPPAANADEVPRFFELQIKTLFQHAWSEANHDLGYKSSAPLSPDDQRLLAFAAAQSWGADRAFEELRSGRSSRSN
jgi:ppGpp synthetase/RelA/SpoT-type nucleotidyltranferase